MDNRTNNKKMTWSLIKKLLVALMSIAVMTVIALIDPSVKSMGEAFAQAEPFWLVLALAAGLGAYFFDMLMYTRTCRLMRYPQSLADGFITTMIGFFYNALTPFQSGGQPMQVVQMRHRGIPAGTATSVLTVKFIAWQSGIVALATAGLIFVGDDVAGHSAGAKAVLYAGYVINAVLLIVAVVILRHPGRMALWGRAVIRFAGRIKLLRKQERIDKLTRAWMRAIEDYGKAGRFIFEQKLKSLPILLYGLLENVSYMSVTYFIYRGFGLNMQDYFGVILLQSLLTIAVSFIPLPGASVASEGGFYLVFGQLFGGTIRFSAMLLWRAFTYYMNIITGVVMVVIDGFRKEKRIVREEDDADGANDADGADDADCANDADGTNDADDFDGMDEDDETDAQSGEA